MPSRESIVGTPNIDAPMWILSASNEFYSFRMSGIFFSDFANGTISKFIQKKNVD